MEEFKVIEVAFKPEDFQESLEDKFFTAKIVQSCEKIDNPEELREIINALAKLAAHRQGLIKGLCMRLAELECKTTFDTNKYPEFFKNASDE